MKAKPEWFPISMKSGSATVKIYREKKASGHYFRVSFYKGSVRCGLNFTDLDAAKKEAKAKAAQLSHGDLEALQITGKDRLVYGRALEAIRPFDMPLDAAAIEFAEAKKLLTGFSLSEAARFYMRHHGRGIHPKPVAEAVAEMIAAKAENGVSTVYLADLRYHLGALATAFHCNINVIVPDDLRRFLDVHAKSPRGYNNRITALHTFFGFAQDRGWVAKDADLLAGIERRKAKDLRPSSIESLEFLTPPVTEQTAIAAVLSEMDAELAGLEQRREKTRALKQAMMQELLTGRTRLL